MFSEFFSSLKKEKSEEIPDIANEKIIILPNLPETIKDILEEAYLLEHKQLQEKDMQRRKEICADALIEYQKALDEVDEAKRKYKGFPSQQDIYIAQGLRIKTRMEYLESVLKGIKQKNPRKVA